MTAERSRRVQGCHIVPATRPSGRDMTAWRQALAHQGPQWLTAASENHRSKCPFRTAQQQCIQLTERRGPFGQNGRVKPGSFRLDQGRHTVRAPWAVGHPEAPIPVYGSLPKFQANPCRHQSRWRPSSRLLISKTGDETHQLRLSALRQHPARPPSRAALFKRSHDSPMGRNGEHSSIVLMAYCLLP